MLWQCSGISLSFSRASAPSLVVHHLAHAPRYVHSRTAPAGGDGKASKNGDVEVGAEVERRYGKIYDEGINPFKEFKDQQKERQKSAMGFVDKVRVPLAAICLACVRLVFVLR